MLNKAQNNLWLRFLRDASKSPVYQLVINLMAANIASDYNPGRVEKADPILLLDLMQFVLDGIEISVGNGWQATFTANVKNTASPRYHVSSYHSSLEQFVELVKANALVYNPIKK